MIWFYSGTPGSGKSLDVARKILNRLRFGYPVVSTVDINMDYVKGKRRKVGKFTYVPLLEITPKWLIEYARDNHKRFKEDQTLLVIDECQLIFNPRETLKKERMDWINLFTQHRKLGFEIILISQFDRLVDRQIRSLFEYEVKHRKINNFKWLWMIPIKVFVRINVWYGIKGKISSEFFIYNKKYSKVYDTFAYSMFEGFGTAGSESNTPTAEGSVIGGGGQGGTPLPPVIEPSSVGVSVLEKGRKKREKKSRKRIFKRDDAADQLELDEENALYTLKDMILRKPEILQEILEDPEIKDIISVNSR